MIITEIVILNGKNFKHSYSDENFYIQKEGTDKIYEEAYDTLNSNFTYIETDKKIEEGAEND